MMTIKGIFKPAVFGLLVFAIVCPSMSQAQEKDPDGWNFIIGAYFYAPTVNGEVKVNNNSAVLTQELNMGGMLGFQAYNPKWSLSSDLMFVNVSTDITVPITDRSGTYEAATTLWGFYAMRKVAKWFDLGLGARLGIVNSKLKVEEGPVLPEIDSESTMWMLPPLVVYRFNFVESEKWTARLRGDIGGFGFFSTFTYLVNPYVGFRVSKLFEPYLGYRVISVYRDDEDGGDQVDMLLYGPQFGFLFHL